MKRKKASFVAIVTVTLLIAFLIVSINAFRFAKSTQLLTNKSLNHIPKKDFDEIAKSIYIDDMIFKGENYNWSATYKVMKNGQRNIIGLDIQQNRNVKDSGKIKYTLKTSAGSTSGILYCIENSFYSTLTNLVPNEKEGITLTIECDNVKSVLNLKNGMAGLVINSKKALQIYINEYSSRLVKDSDKYIYFHNIGDKKIWILPFNGGYASVNAVTGEIQNFKDEYNEELHSRDYR